MILNICKSLLASFLCLVLISCAKHGDSAPSTGSSAGSSSGSQAVSAGGVALGSGLSSTSTSTSTSSVSKTSTSTASASSTATSTGTQGAGSTSTSTVVASSTASSTSTSTSNAVGAAAAFSIIGSPSKSSSSSGVVQVTGIAGSQWLNVAAYDLNNASYKVGADITPSNGTFTMNLYTNCMAPGPAKVNVVAFSVPAYAAGGLMQSFELDFTVAASNIPCNIPAAAEFVQGATLPSAVSPLPAGSKITFDDEFSALSISDTDNAGTNWYSNRIQCCLLDTSHPNTATAMAGINSPAGQKPFSLTQASDGSGSALDITLQKTGSTWYSGVLASTDFEGHGFQQQYGYFEIKAKFPTGQGTWPAFWMLNAFNLPSVDPGEIDIFETYSILGSTPAVVSTLHNWNPSYVAAHGNNSTVNPSGSPSIVNEPNMYVGTDAGFHTYGLLWTAETMNFYYDNNLIYSTPTLPEFKQPYFMILDLGLGGGWPTTNTPQKNDMQIKYVRAYQLPQYITNP